MEEFQYNVPFLTFDKVFENDDNADSFFDTNRIDDFGPKPRTEIVNENICGLDNNDEFFSPNAENSERSFKSCASTAKFSLKKVRRSMSMSDLVYEHAETASAVSLDAQMDALTLANGSNEEKQEEKPLVNHIRRFASKENINRLAKPRRCNSQDRSNKNQRTEHISLAEAVLHFQKQTPKRFRTKAPMVIKAPLLPRGLTVAKTPKLTSARRARPNYAVSSEEQQRIEIEEQLKYQFKAHPVNKKILLEPHKIEIEKKPATAVQPFDITEIKKKEIASEVPVREFHALPVPKTNYIPPHFERKHIVSTHPITPKFMKRLPKLDQPKVEQAAAAAQKPAKLTNTKPVPFSFEKRDERIRLKKEEMIRQVAEEERKAREFHARPAPKSSRNSSQEKLSDCGKSNKSDSEEHRPVFKARPALVLQAKPFVPEKRQHTIETCEFNLATTERKQAWEDFDRKVREREKVNDENRRKCEMEQRAKEEEEKQALRKQAEVKAHGIKKYKPLNIMPSYKVTQPISPKFHYTNKGQNKENVAH